MAQTSTLRRFRIELADMDRSVYDGLDLRVAQHPSEDAERVVVRVLARALLHEEGLEFGRGLSNVEDPALWTRSPVGDVETWVDVGMPSADRLHRASKRARKVVVVTHKLEGPLRKEWSSRSIHRADAIEVVRLPAPLVRALAQGLERTVTWYVSVQDGAVSVTQGDQPHDGEVARTTIAEFVDATAG